MRYARESMHANHRTLELCDTAAQRNRPFERIALYRGGLGEGRQRRQQGEADNRSTRWEGPHLSNMTHPDAEAWG
jgi:hypothetical protein